MSTETKEKIYYINQNSDFVIIDDYFMYFKEGRLIAEGKLIETTKQFDSFFMNDNQIDFVHLGSPVSLMKVTAKETKNALLKEIEGHYENLLFDFSAEIVNEELLLHFQGKEFTGPVDVIEEKGRTWLINRNRQNNGIPMDMLGFEKFCIEENKLIYFTDEDQPQQGRITLRKVD